MNGEVIDVLPPLKDLGFGQCYCPLMAVAHFQKGEWKACEIVPTKALSLHPGSKVLHYAQEIFEGLKAFKTPKGILLFRPQLNIKRMTESAKIMAMPPFPEQEYLRVMKELVNKCEKFIPEEPGALYLRPTMIGTSPTLGVASANDYMFYVLASPVGGYFGSVKADVPACIQVMVTNEYVRAVRGGVGSAKTGANYAASLRAVTEAKKKGFHNVLFLDALERRFLEELSGMNVFVVDNGVLSTPALGDTILKGVTRDSILALAQTMNIPTREDAIEIEALIKGFDSGRVSEMFACGTGASITAINQIGWKDRKISIGTGGNPGALTSKLYGKLLEIQNGRAEPPSQDWIVKC